jgi:hypothetical protein
MHDVVPASAGAIVAKRAMSAYKRDAIREMSRTNS